MSTAKILQFLNIIILLVNGFIFFMPKRPVGGMHTNAAGGLLLFALAVLIVIVIHLILLAIALWYNKTTLLKVTTVAIVPLSFLFWYFIGPTVRL